MLVESMNDKAKEKAEKEILKICKIEKFFGNLVDFHRPNLLKVQFIH